jgi:hypothetical protein
MKKTETMKKFEELVFKPHPRGGVHCILEFDNGHAISILGGVPSLIDPTEFSSLGDGVNTFEVWKSYAERPAGYQTREQVVQHVDEASRVCECNPIVGFRAKVEPATKPE